MYQLKVKLAEARSKSSQVRYAFKFDDNYYLLIANITEDYSIHDLQSVKSAVAYDVQTLINKHLASKYTVVENEMFAPPVQSDLQFEYDFILQDNDTGERLMYVAVDADVYEADDQRYVINMDQPFIFLSSEEYRNWTTPEILLNGNSTGWPSYDLSYFKQPPGEYSVNNIDVGYLYLI